MKNLKGIAGKLILGVIVFGILLGAVCSVMGYREFTAVLEQQYNDSAYEIAEAATAFLNPDKFDAYLSTGETDAEFDEIQNRLDILVNTTNATLIYVAKVDTSDYQTLTYIYDSVNESTGFSRYPFGYTAIGVDEKYINNVRNMITKGERATEYLYSYSEESGAHTTAGLPVYDSNGNIVAVIGVEKAMTRLENARNTYVLHVILWTLAVIILFVCVYTMILRRSIIKPILTVTDEAKRFAETNTTSDHLLAIQQKDEIGILARAVGKMEQDIVNYTQNLTMITAEKERVNTELSIATRIQA
ncbi:MAG: HAMP domain-containing protein, partial [Oscillospiraceae bacterium]|nr:HAMP domain-containing protein [Oscillospiraceae bacterium]